MPTPHLLGARALAALLLCALPSASAFAQQAAPTQKRPLTVDSQIGELLDNPASRAVLQKIVPILANNQQLAAARNLPLRAIAQYAPTVLTDAVLKQIDVELAKTPGAVASGKVNSAARPMDPRDALTLKTIPLWDGKAPGALGDGWQDRPSITVVSPGETSSFGTAVIVAPGGGYQALASGMEGRQVADWFAAHGVTAFVLTYRLTSFGYKHPTQLMDAKRAIRWVRAHAGDYGVNPKRIGMIGFSAGGHLTAMAETQFDAGDPAAADPVERVSSRPDFAVLSYAAIDRAGNGWTARGLVDPKNTPEQLDQLKPAEHVRADTPPTFLWGTTTDELVPPDNLTRMYLALVNAKVPAELHIFARGRHGLGLGMTEPALSVWPTLLQNWLEAQALIGAKVTNEK